MAPLKVSRIASETGRYVAQIDAMLLVEPAQGHQPAMQPDALVVARLTQQPDDPLALAERIDAHQMSALGKGGDGAQQLAISPASEG